MDKNKIEDQVKKSVHISGALSIFFWLDFEGIFISTRELYNLYLKLFSFFTHSLIFIFLKVIIISNVWVKILIITSTKKTNLTQAN